MDEVSKTDVFFNCPFDQEYAPLFEAITFTLVACGYNPRSARENSDTSKNRLEFITELVKQCRLGVHDLSREKPRKSNQYSRFNLPFELGMHLARKAYAGPSTTERMRLFVLEGKPKELQKALSDINGLDPKCHQNQPYKAIGLVRNFLHGDTEISPTPGAQFIRRAWDRFDVYLSEEFCPKAGLAREEILYQEFVQSAREFCVQGL
ncbi:MAG: hypothetical protein AAGH87_01820 [Pseudomonadota bacterium]